MNFKKQKEKEREKRRINSFKSFQILFLLKIQIHPSFDGITD
jgi:hypothetical protein